ncbi:MAG: alpha/beta hydrolase [bacterium]
MIEILITILQGLGIFIAMFVVYLLIVAIVPGISVPAQPLKSANVSNKKEDGEPPVSRKDVRFEVKGTSLSAWLYLPENLSAPVPCIIMGNGLGGTKDVLLEQYAVRFQAAGFAVLVFDYRHFGDSEGEPCQLVWIPYQLQDYAAAVSYARSLAEIDAEKIALWGTSLSGGHVIVAAAKDQNITCVVAQCPWLDGLATARYAAKIVGIGRGLRLVMHGQRDIVRSFLGLSPHKIPIAGKTGSVAILPITEAYEAFATLAAQNFINEACARIVIRIDKYRPIKYAAKVRCPVLLQICERDEPLPIQSIDAAAQKMAVSSEVKRYPIGHFDIYVGENFEKSISDQLNFFKSHLEDRKQ